MYHVRCFLTQFKSDTNQANGFEQDMGNTNYCVFVPRLEFNRVTSADLVASALKNLDIPAYVNERNDICVDKFKMSFPFSLSLICACPTMKDLTVGS